MPDKQSIQTFERLRSSETNLISFSLFPKSYLAGALFEANCNRSRTSPNFPNLFLCVSLCFSVFLYPPASLLRNSSHSFSAYILLHRLCQATIQALITHNLYAHRHTICARLHPYVCRRSRYHSRSLLIVHSGQVTWVLTHLLCSSTRVLTGLLPVFSSPPVAPETE